MDGPAWLRIAARLLGVGGALYGAFLVVVASALQAMDAGPPAGPLLTVAIPALAVAAAIVGAAVLSRRRALAAGALAASAALVAAAQLALRLRPLTLVVPAVVALAALLAFTSPGSRVARRGRS